MRIESEALPSSDHPFRLPRTLEVLLGVLVMLELVAPFTPKSYGLDGGAHLNWIHQFSDLFVAGVFLPRWAPTAFGWFGAATFYFYPPLTFYIASLVRIASGISSPSVLFQLTGLIGTIASFWTCRTLLHSLPAPRYQMNLGSLLYAFGPLRLFDLYNRCTLSSHLAYVSFPLVWMALVRIQRYASNDTYQRKELIRWIILLGLSSAMLALTSVPLSIALLLTALLVAFIYRRWVTVRGTVATIAGGVLALALSSFHFAASLAARPYTWLKEIEISHIPTGLISIVQHWRSPESYQLDIIYVSTIIIAIGYWKRGHMNREGRASNLPEILTARAVFLILIVFLFLDSAFSQPLWNLLEFQLLQFPSRLCTQIILGMAMIVGLARTPGLQRAARGISWLWICGALVPATLVVSNLHLSQHSEPALTDATEYRPIYTMPRPAFLSSFKDHFNDPPYTTSLNAGEYLKQTGNDPTSNRLVANFNVPHLVYFHRFYWPNWHLYLNGREQRNWPDSIGRATTMIPQGSSMLEWRLEPSPLEQAGIWVSATTLAIITVISGAMIVRGRSHKTREDVLL